MPQADTPNITLASDAIFETRGEAEAAIKTVKPCSSLGGACRIWGDRRRSMLRQSPKMACVEGEIRSEDAV
jgi:hypothetical protein